MGLDMSGPVKRITGTTHDDLQAQYDATGSIWLRPGAYIDWKDEA